MWIREDGSEAAFSKDTIENEDMDFNAAWQKKITITFDPNGGVVGEKEREMAPGKIGSLPRTEQPAATSLDYEFDYWADADGNKVTANSVFTEDATLTAQWKVIKRRLAFDSNYRTSSDGAMFGKYIYTDEVSDLDQIKEFRISEFPDIGHLNYEHELIGWFTEKEGGEEKVINLNKLILPEEDPDGSAARQFLPGAALKLLDSSGETALHYLEATDEFTGTEWTSGDGAHTVKLGADENTLVETEAPDNYAVADPVKFTLNRDGTITIKSSRSRATTWICTISTSPWIWWSRTG